MPVLAKRALLAALTVVGLVLLVLGLWFTVHLGLSGTATFTAKPAAGSVVVLEPSVLNRVDQPVTVTARASGDTQLWAGLAAPSDATTIVGGADTTTVTGAHVRSWTLQTTRKGAGPAPALADADVWHSTRTGKGTLRVTVDQADAPESLVLATPGGTAAPLKSVTLTVHRPTWVFQSLLGVLVGLLAVVAGAVGLWQLRPRSPQPTDPAEPDAGRPTEEVRA